ncbi:MAG: glycosyltransferase family 2 protein [Bdellovibrionales bacterium]|nr:glycosyltransferase family 2 protein [Bdellovibrionales bacterium]
MQSWTIILFGYNEGDSMDQTLEATLKVAKELSDDFEILLVDDGSTDNTVARSQEWLDREPRLRILRHAQNQGIGSALHTGYAAATKENLVALPLDGQFDPRELLPFAEIPDHQVISFCRYGRPGYSLYRKGLSHFNRALNSTLLGLHLNDVNWVKIYKREDLQSLPLSIQSSLVESEICAKLTQTGCQFVEIPSRYLPRRGGIARGASPRQLYETAKETWQLVQAVKRWKTGAERVKG